MTSTAIRTAPASRTYRPNSADYPADPLMNTAIGNNWYAGNYHNADGEYDVKEGVPRVQRAAARLGGCRQDQLQRGGPSD